MKIAWVVTLLTVAAGCGRRSGYGTSGGEATCGGVCDHYTGCRDDDDPKVYGACLQECGEIFYEDGVPDVQSIRQFQRMRCPDVLTFVEGKSGRPLGTEPADAATAKK